MSDRRLAPHVARAIGAVQAKPAPAADARRKAAGEGVPQKIPAPHVAAVLQAFRNPPLQMKAAAAAPRPAAPRAAVREIPVPRTPLPPAPRPAIQPMKKFLLETGANSLLKPKNTKNAKSGFIAEVKKKTEIKKIEGPDEKNSFVAWPLGSVWGPDEPNSFITIARDTSRRLIGKHLRYLQDIAISGLKSSHFQPRHGFQVTREQHKIRVFEGLTPDGKKGKKGSSSSFLNPGIEEEALHKAVDLYTKKYQDEQATDCFEFDLGVPVGIGIQRQYGEARIAITTRVKACFVDGILKTMFPVLEGGTLGQRIERLKLTN